MGKPMKIVVPLIESQIDAEYNKLQQQKESTDLPIIYPMRENPYVTL